MSFRAVTHRSSIAFVIAAASVIAGCGTATLHPERGALHFGEVYVGASADRTLKVEETGGVDADLAALRLAGQDAGTFAVIAPAGSTTVPGGGSTNLVLRFTPVEARRHGDAELMPTSLGRVDFPGFPVFLRGIGVYQKSEPYLRIAAGDHPPTQPLEFGDVELGKSAEEIFVVNNDHNLPLPATVVWPLADAAFSAPAVSGPITIPARSRALVRLRFTPSAVKDYSAVVELQAGKAFAGIVLHGRGIAQRAAASGLGLTPGTVSPGDTIELSYTLSHPSGVGQITSVTLEGLPQAPGAPETTLPLPTAAGGAVSGVKVTIPKPTMDGRYTMKLRVRQQGGPDTVADFPVQLAVKDVPARISELVIRADTHDRRECPGELLPRTVEYRVTDDNGASDVYNARITEVQPQAGAEALIVLPPNVPLGMPGNPSVVSDLATTTIQVRCRARSGTSTLVLKWDEDDKSVSPSLVGRLRETLTYRVTP